MAQSAILIQSLLFFKQGKISLRKMFQNKMHYAAFQGLAYVKQAGMHNKTFVDSNLL